MHRPESNKLEACQSMIAATPGIRVRSSCSLIAEILQETSELGNSGVTFGFDLVERTAYLSHQFPEQRDLLTVGGDVGV